MKGKDDKRMVKLGFFFNLKQKKLPFLDTYFKKK